MQAGVVNLSSFVGGLDKSFLAGVSASSVWGTIPEILFFAFQVGAVAFPFSALFILKPSRLRLPQCLHLPQRLHHPFA